MTEYKILVIEYFRATHTQIHEVFNRYNKQGKHLNAEEIRNALFHDLDLMRGILVSAGDTTDFEEVAPFLVDDSRDDTGKPRRLSTAGQINAFLRRVQRDDADQLRDVGRLQDLFSLLAQSTAAVVAEPDVWPPQFKDGASGSGWQELPLVGTLIGVSAAAAVLGEDLQNRLRSARFELRQSTANDAAWQRPEKTQTATQWAHIAAVALGTLNVLGVPPHEASVALRRRFSQSGLQALITIDSMRR